MEEKYFSIFVRKLSQKNKKSITKTIQGFIPPDHTKTLNNFHYCIYTVHLYHWHRPGNLCIPSAKRMEISNPTKSVVRVGHLLHSRSFCRAMQTSLERKSRNLMERDQASMGDVVISLSVYLLYWNSFQFENYNVNKMKQFFSSNKFMNIN